MLHKPCDGGKTNLNFCMWVAPGARRAAVLLYIPMGGKGVAAVASAVVLPCICISALSELVEAVLYNRLGLSASSALILSSPRPAAEEPSQCQEELRGTTALPSPQGRQD